MKKSQKAYLPFKRLIGILGSLVGIIVCFIFLWWWIIPVNAIVTKGHPFFVHGRIGKHKKTFKMIKFRSMRLDANPNLAPSDMTEDYQKSLETGFGRFLRKTSFDETPQLLNIFIGHMAFIGPRPGAAQNEDDLIKARESYTPNAFDVRPGLGGMAQLKMNREHSPDIKAKYDHEYVLNISFLLDAKLFILTCLRLFGAGKGR